ncbi:MAG: hypothetical protein H0V29_06690 [Thermoleophilaceae bacterium]|nr:hypothetical protein [Thermoleophilaceae bacterium]
MFWRRERILLDTVQRNVEAFEALTTVLERMVKEMDDMRDQLRANTEATWRMVDRLDGGEPAT